jgi:hypothetical protein
VNHLKTFLIVEDLMLNSWNISSRVSKGGALDHMHILLKLEMPQRKRVFPLKFNDKWL